MDAWQQVNQTPLVDAEGHIHKRAELAEASAAPGNMPPSAASPVAGPPLTGN